MTVKAYKEARWTPSWVLNEVPYFQTLITLTKKVLILIILQ